MAPSQPLRQGLGTRNVPRAVREREMLEVGRRLFAERGYDAVSMAEIARAAGVSKPMVYAYFESKEGLFLACVDDATDDLMRKLEEAVPPTLEPDVRLWQGLLATFTFMEESPDTWAMLHPRDPQPGGRLAAGAERSTEAMTALIARLLCDAAVAQGIDAKVAREATEPMAHALVAAVQAVAAWWLRNPGDPKERQALRLMNFAWMGLANLVQGNLWLPPEEGRGSGRRVTAIGSAARSEELAEALRSDRDAALDEIFRRMGERFSPARAKGVEAVAEWRVRGRRGGGHDRFQLLMGGGECRVERDGRAKPDVVFTIGAADFARLVSGHAGGAALSTFGRLKIDGDVMLAARVPSFFERGAPG